MGTIGLFIQIIGALGFLFRFWLCEFKVKDDLGPKRAHTSRFISVYFLLAMALDFPNNILTLITVVSAPAMVLVFLMYDLPFYFQDCFKPMEHKWWLILERITLHPPIFAYAIYFYATQTRLFYFDLFTLPNLIIALVLVCIPLFVLDPRVVKKENWPRGIIMLVGGIIDIIGNLIFYSRLAVSSNFPRFFDGLF